jgi:hypothetical protein
VLTVDGFGQWFDLFLGELADHAAEELVLFWKFKVHSPVSFAIATPILRQARLAAGLAQGRL